MLGSSRLRSPTAHNCIPQTASAIVKAWLQNLLDARGHVAIERIQKLQGYRIFRDFTWGGLPDFGKYNLIYG
jgi:hypothetical protein